MTDHHQQLARQIVNHFLDSLSHEAREYITAAQFEGLGEAIRQALSHEHEHIADLLEAVVKTLRSGIHKPELGL